MALAASEKPPSVGQLLQEGLQHWRGHQRAFWVFGAIAATAIVVLKMIGQSGLSGIVAVFYIFVFDQWLKLAMFPDWKQRELLWRKSKETRRLAHPSMVFWGFGFAYSFVVFAGGMLLIFFVAPDVFRGRIAPSTVLSSAAAAGLALLFATLVFAGNLLVLPARIAGLKWNLGDAFREAQGMRLSLVTLAVICTLISLIGPLLISINALVQPPAFLALALMLQVLTVVFDLIALYLIAYGASRLFIFKTGWKPAPLPAS
jgi:hypothetical protein